MKAAFALLLLVSCSAHAQTDERHLSLDSIGRDEVIEFSVLGHPKNGGPEHLQLLGPMILDVRVASFPEPHAEYWLQVCAGTVMPTAEKAWGHAVNEKVERSLNPDDIIYLNQFFARYQSQGEISPINDHDIRGEIQFDFRRKYGRDWGREVVQCYRADAKLDAEFARRFFGLKDG